MPAAAQRSRMSPSFQRCTLRAWSRTISIMDSTGLVEATVRSSAPVTPRRVTVNISARPSRRLTGGVRGELLQLTGECLEVPGRLVGVWIRPSAAQFAPHPPVLPLRQVVEDPPLLVDPTTLDQRLLAEDVLHLAAQRLAAVEHEQDPAGGVHPEVAQVGHQPADYRGVRGGALHHPAAP